MSLPLFVVNQKFKRVAGGGKILFCFAKPLGKRLNG